LYPLLLRTYNTNKFENSSKERIDFLLQANGIIFLKKHVDVNHNFIAKMFEEEINFLLKGKEERQLTSK
jgi:hypothetical protein